MQTERKTEILDAFVRLVCRFGLDKTTMQDVAREASISVGSIYNDFKNKEELIDAFVNRIHLQFVENSKKLLVTGIPAEQMLHDFIINFFLLVGETLHQNRGFLQLLKGEESFRYFRKNYAKQDRLTSEICSLIADVMKRGVQEGVFEIDDPLRTAQLFLKTFNDYFKFMMFSEDPNEALIGIEEMYAFVIKAIRKH